MLSLGVLNTSHCRLHKKVGLIFLVLMYPRLGRAKNGVFSTASPAGAAAVGWHCGDRRHFGVRCGARHAFLSWRGLSADPNRRSKASLGPIWFARHVYSRSGLLNTPKNARCSPGDPCVRRKPCLRSCPHRHFAALTFSNAGPDNVDSAPVWRRGAGYKVYREFRTSRRPLNVAFVRAGLPGQETLYPAPPEPHGSHR